MVLSEELTSISFQTMETFLNQSRDVPSSYPCRILHPYTLPFVIHGNINGECLSTSNIGPAVRQQNVRILTFDNYGRNDYSRIYKEMKGYEGP